MSYIQHTTCWLIANVFWKWELHDGTFCLRLFQRTVNCECHCMSVNVSWFLFVPVSTPVANDFVLRFVWHRSSFSLLCEFPPAYWPLYQLSTLYTVDRHVPIRLGDFVLPVQTTDTPRQSNMVTNPLRATVQLSSCSNVPRYFGFSNFYSAEVV